MVALNLWSYINKIKEMLLDANMYEIIENDTTKRLTNDLRQLLSHWENESFHRCAYISEKSDY